MKASGIVKAVMRNPDGSVAWEEEVHNAETVAGINYLLGVALGGQAQLTTWYLGLIDGATTPTLDEDDTMSSHAGWTENQDYSGSTRPTWSPGSAAGKTIRSNSSASFTMNASGTLAGAFLISNNTKGGTTGTLYMTALFQTARAYVSGQVLNLNYIAKGAAG